MTLLARRVFERNVVGYRNAWLLFVSGIAEPVFYLGSVGLGFGHLVGSVPFDGHRVGYTDFVAPALLATSAMNGAIIDSTFNVFGKLQWLKIYDATLATPVTTNDIALGEVGFSLARGLLYTVSFLSLMGVLGVIHSWWALLAVPATVLVALCFASLGIAVTTYIRNWQDFDLVQMATLPMFLFSATFYPLTAYAGGLRLLVRCTPLYNGVALLRSLTLGNPSLATAGHVLYLAVGGALGVWIAGGRLQRRLLR